MNCKKTLSVFLLLCLLLSTIAIPGIGAATVDTAETKAQVELASTEATDYNLADNVQDGQILQCWTWSYDNIAANMEKIASQGFSAIQTSPIQASKESTKEYYSTISSQCWVYYQPISFTIETNSYNALGTKSDFEAMCEVAHQYGVKVIVDTIFNHMANDMTENTIHPSIPSEIKDNSSCWHDISINCSNYSDRYNITQYCLSGLPDLNTSNSTVQKHCTNFLKECIDAGADGFRFDAVKHIETPEDDSSFASNFWPNVLNAATEYAQSSSRAFTPYYYGELLDDPGNGNITAYTKYMSVTDNQGSNSIRSCVVNGDAAGAANYGIFNGAAPSKTVQWTESHDTHKDSGTAGISEHNINKTWAIVGARDEVCGQYLARPSNMSTTMLGSADQTSWTYPEVKAVNQFKNAMIGEPEYFASSGSVAYIERGTRGVVLVNVGGTYYNNMSVPAHTIADGTYTDAVTGNTFTVANGNISGDIGDTGIAVVYDTEYTGDSSGGSTTTTSYSLVGSFNAWDNTANVMSGDSTTVSTKLTLDAGTYTFKIYSPTTDLWYGNTGNIEDTTTATSSSGWTMDSSVSDDCTLTASGGTYTFNFNTSTKKLVVLHSTETEETTTTSTPAVPYYLLGSFNNWASSTPMAATSEENVISTTLELEEGSYTFKIYDNTSDTWYGNTGNIEDTTTTTSSGGWTMDSSVSDNCTLTASGGTYTFNFNTSTKRLIVLYTPAETDPTETTYTVTFVDYDGTVLDTQTVVEGSSATAPADPTRDGDAQYTYTFAGWDTDFSKITADTTVTATYSSTVNSYTVTFVDYDGTVINTQTVEYGKSATAPADPTRDGDAQYTYTFAGWDTDFSKITADTTVTATYSSTVNSYTVTFVDYDGTVLNTQTVEYGKSATAPADPTRDGDAQYTYTFAGWDTDFSKITADTTVTATYTSTVNSYTVTFVDYDGTVLDTQTVEYGKSATAPADPTRDGYTFTGWDTGFENITADITVTATYEQTGDIYYTVTFVDFDGTVLKEEKVLAGSDATPPLEPLRESTTSGSSFMATTTYYIFDSWDGSYTNVQADTTVTATYTTDTSTRWNTKTYYFVYFKDWDGTILKQQNIKSGNTVTPPDDPSREGYTFTGWDSTNFTITAETTYTATYSANVTSYTVTFVDYDGTVLDTQTVEQGKAATAPADPTRDGDAQYTYTFAGWDTDFSKITADTTVTATYSSTVNSYTVTFVDYDGTVLDTQTVEYGKAATAPADPTRDGDAQYTYTFAGWDTDFSKITADTTVTATYSSTVNSYTVTFVDYDGTVLDTQTVEYGKAATAPADPTREGYTFAGWDTDFSKITADTTVTATYSANVTSYTVTFVDYDGTVLDTQTVEYGKSATAPADPTREGYTFAGWDTDFSKITADTTVTAKYTQNVTASATGILKIDMVGGTSFTISINGGAARPQGSAYHNSKAPVGVPVTVVARTTSFSEFLGWINPANGAVVSKDLSFSFYTSGNDFFKAMFASDIDGVNMVAFYNAKADQYWDIQYYAAGDEIVKPDPIPQVGFDFVGWSMTDEQIQAALEAGEDVTVLAVWEKQLVYVDVIVNGGKITAHSGQNAEGKYLAASAVTVAAGTAPAGQKFAYWMDHNGNIKSYETTYKFYPVEDTTLTAVFVASDATIEYKTLASVDNCDTSGQYGIFTFSWYVPEAQNGYDYQASGIIFVNKDNYKESTFVYGSTDSNVYVRTVTGTNAKPSNTFTWTAPMFSGQTWVAKTWVQYLDADGELVTVYSDEFEAYKE